MLYISFTNAVNADLIKGVYQLSLSVSLSEETELQTGFLHRVLIPNLKPYGITVLLKSSEAVIRTEYSHPLLLTG